MYYVTWDFSRFQKINVNNKEINYDVTYDGHQNTQNVHKIYFQPIVVTSICDIKLMLLCVKLIV